MPTLEIKVSSPAREVLIDITERIQRAVAESDPAFSGMVNVFVPHTTAGVTINEGADPSVARDIVEGLTRFVPRDAAYRHSEGNSDAHIKGQSHRQSCGRPCRAGQIAPGHLAECLLG